MHAQLPLLLQLAGITADNVAVASAAVDISKLDDDAHVCSHGMPMSVPRSSLQAESVRYPRAIAVCLLQCPMPHLTLTTPAVTQDNLGETASAMVYESKFTNISDGAAHYQ